MCDTARVIRSNRQERALEKESRLIKVDQRINQKEEQRKRQTEKVDYQSTTRAG